VARKPVNLRGNRQHPPPRDGGGRRGVLGKHADRARPAVGSEKSGTLESNLLTRIQAHKESGQGSV